MSTQLKKFGTILKNLALNHREAVDVATDLGLSLSSAPEAFIDDLLPALTAETRTELLTKVQQRDKALFDSVMRPDNG